MLVCYNVEERLPEFVRPETIHPKQSDRGRCREPMPADDFPTLVTSGPQPKRRQPMLSTRSPASLPRLALTFAFITLALATLCSAAAQSGDDEAASTAPRSNSPQDLERFSERASVLEVQIPVNVTTRKGDSVRGLTADDFELFDDGERREITRFEVIDLKDVRVEPGHEDVARQAIPPSARRHFLFLFDLSFSSPTSVVRARQSAQRFVASSMHPTDLAAVATHSVEFGFKLVLTFTPDRAQLARAIETLDSPDLMRLAGFDPLQFFVEPNESYAGGSNLELPSADLGGNFRTEAANAYAEILDKMAQRTSKNFERARIASWTQSLAEIGDILESVSGRKHLIYFTEGFDGRLLLGRQPDNQDPEDENDTLNVLLGNIFLVDNDDRFGNTQLQSDVNVMIERFKRTDSVLQIVDTSGLTAETGVASNQQRVSRDALFWIADGTGGQLFKDANRFEDQLREVLERSAVTYLLTFRADDVVADGAFHPIRIKADTGRGVTVSHRSGYFAPKPYEELSPIERQLLASDQIANAVVEDDVALNVLTAAFRSGGSRAYVPVIIEASGADLLADHEGPLLGVEFYTYVTDASGQMRDFFTQLVTLNLESGDAGIRRGGVKYYGHVEVPPGEYTVRVLARNARTGRTGVRSVALSIPELEEELALLPPFFLEEPGSWLLVRESSTSDQESLVYPFTIEGRPFVPAALPRLSTSGESELCLVAYNLGDQAPQIESVVRSADGEVMSGGRLVVLDRTVTGIAGLDKVTARFLGDGLEVGDYTLTVTLTDPASQNQTTSEIALQITS
jgi:VWFA-related protein